VLANPERRRVRGSVRIAGADDRLFQPVNVPGEPLQADGDVLTLLLPPLGGGIYVASPAR
jgi:hypothetical protein